MMILAGYEDVRDFHDQHGIPTPARPILPPADVHEYRMKFLREELQEINDAAKADDLTGYLDGLIDLVYVAYGTAILTGVSPELWQRLWDQVQTANLCKRRAASADESKRGHSFDVVKPKGWVSPEPTMRMIIEHVIATGRVPR